jgi:hypothetical protein
MALSLKQLRDLARLHADGIEGAGQEIEITLNNEPEEIAAVLGVGMDIIERVRSSDSPSTNLARLIEGHHRRKRQARVQDVQSDAYRLAELLGVTCVLSARGLVTMDLRLLAELLRFATGFDRLAFRVGGDMRSVDLRVLRALFRECRGVEVTDLHLGDEHLVLSYRTGRSQGLVRLLHRAPEVTERILVVAVAQNLEPAVLDPLPARVDLPPTFPDPEEPVRRSGPTPFRTALRHLLDALVTGAAP